MKLEPVYLVAPPRRVTTRRAFLFAVGSACGGIAVGFTGGWFARGWRVDAAPAAKPPGAAIDPKIAALIAWAKDLAERGDESELRAELAGFLAAVRQAHVLGADTPQMWRTVEHVARMLASDEAIPSRRALAKSTLACWQLNGSTSTIDKNLLAAIERLAGSPR